MLLNEKTYILLLMYFGTSQINFNESNIKIRYNLKSRVSNLFPYEAYTKFTERQGFYNKIKFSKHLSDHAIRNYSSENLIN